MLGRAAGVESNSRKAKAEKQKAMESGVDEVSAAIKEMMRWPEDERQSRLARLAAQIESVAASAEEFKSADRLRRLEAAEQVIELLKRASASKP
jgi:hypothetical protein